MNDEFQMTNGTPAGESAGSFRNLPFASFDIRHSSFDIFSVHHLAPQGMAGFVLANGSMSSNQSGEGDIRRALIEADLLDCMVALPGHLFYSTQPIEALAA
jgi:type I restriction-modification system DNA methylase subunit